MDNSQKVLQKTKQLKDKVEAFNSLVSKWEDTLVLIDLANEENDESMLPDVVSAAEEIEADIDKMTLETLLSGHYDKNNAIMTFHAGAGGTEAQGLVQNAYPYVSNVGAEKRLYRNCSRFASG